MSARRRSREWRGTGVCLAVVAAVLLAACSGDDAATTPTKSLSTPTTAAGTSVATSTKSSATASDSSAAAQLAAINTAIPAGIMDGKALGPKDAKVTLDVYEDFQCPFCLKFNVVMLPTLVEYANAGKLRVEFKSLPILGAESAQAAVAAECAASQGLFWPFFQRLYSEQLKAGQLAKEQTNVGRFSKENLAAYAVAAGAKPDDFAACYGSEASIASVQVDFRAGQAAGIRGTPGLLLNGTFVATPANATALRKLLDDPAAK